MNQCQYASSLQHYKLHELIRGTSQFHSFISILKASKMLNCHLSPPFKNLQSDFAISKETDLHTFIPLLDSGLWSVTGYCTIYKMPIKNVWDFLRQLSFDTLKLLPIWLILVLVESCFTCTMTERLLNRLEVDSTKLYCSF